MSLNVTMVMFILLAFTAFFTCCVGGCVGEYEWVPGAVLVQADAPRRKPKERNLLMPLRQRKQRDGRLRENWYARYEVNGKRFTVNL